MKSKIKIESLQADTNSVEGIQDLSKQQTIQIVGGASFEGFQISNELLTGSRFYFEADNRVTERAILEITGLSVE